MHSKLRSWLTIIGIVIGVGAVVGIISLGDAMQGQMQSRLASMDLTSITISPGYSRAQSEGPGFRHFGGGTTTDAQLTDHDIDALRGVEGITYVTGEISGREDISYNGENATLSITGVDPQVWKYMNSLEVGSGRLAKGLPGRRAWGPRPAAALLLCPASGLAAHTPQLPPLTTVSGSPRLPGKFVWADLVTDDVPAARKFYGNLFGWTFRDVGNYTIAANDDRPLCGMFQRPRPTDSSRPSRAGSATSPFRASKRAQHAVTKAGGKVPGRPKKFPKRGEQAVFADAEGAVFGVVKSSSGDPADFLADPGDWIWIQLLSRDGQKAAEFYRAVGGYEIIENTTTNKLSDYVLTSEGYARATVRTIRTDNEKVRPAWLPFVRVKNVGESVAQAKQLGGKALIEPKPELLDGKVAVIADPTGAAIGILEWSGELVKGGQKP